METPANEYWAQRFEALTDELISGSGTACETAERLFRMAERDIEADLARWYTRLAENNEISYAAARKLLNADELKEFKWTLEEYIKRGKENGVTADWRKELENASAKFHISRLEAIRVQIRQHLEELYGNYADELDDTMRRTYSDGYYKTAYTLETGFHAGFDVSKLDTAAIDTLLAKPWAADGKNFSDRIWADKAKLLETLQTELIQGLIRGSTQADIVKRFAAKMKTSLSNAARLIATESAYFAAVGEKDGMKALGVEKYRYLATLDSRTSEICREMDGKVFTMAEYKPGVTAPPLHVWCRSTTVPYFGEKGGLRAARNTEGKTEYIPDMDYEDWKAVFVDKTRTLEEAENQRYGRDKATTVNRAYIESGEYRRKFDKLTDNPDVNRVLYQKAKEMLFHRSGTHREDMYWIDGDTGEIITSVLDETHKQRIKRRKGIITKLMGRTNVISMHTHPESMPPSDGDFNAMYELKYAKAFVICHDGKIFQYHANEFIDSDLYLFYIARKIQIGYNEFEAQLMVLRMFAEKGALSFREVTLE